MAPPSGLRLFRVTRNLSQTELATMLGVSRITVSNWENAKHRIPQRVLDHIAKLELLPVESPKVQATTVAQAVDAYSFMRRQGMTHDYIVRSVWKDHPLDRETQLAIVARWPDIIQPPKEQ